MLKLMLHGAMGVMGGNVVSCAESDPDIMIACGVEKEECSPDPSLLFPVYQKFSGITEDFDVIIDFSVAEAVDGLLNYAEEKGKPLVLCTTGLSERQLRRVEEVSKKIPILRSANMSIGINLLIELMGAVAEKLYSQGFDIEILEEHHRRKKDAPSGTALSLKDAVENALKEGMDVVFDRSGRRTARPHGEIGISSIRGGTLPGVHEVIFAGEDEVITFSHTAYSRRIFAKGALAAAHFLVGKEPGLYDMKDVIS